MKSQWENLKKTTMNPESSEVSVTFWPVYPLAIFLPGHAFLEDNFYTVCLLQKP